MKFFNWKRLGVALAAVVAFGHVHAAYPDRPIRLVIPYATGGMGSLFGNLINERVSPILGQQIVVDYRPGASGAIGAALVKQSPPDGYTVLMITNSMFAIAPHLHKDLPYDPIKDFEPVGLVWTSSNLLLVPSGSPLGSVADLVNAAKAQPGKHTFGSAGNGSTAHLTSEMLKHAAGLDMRHVPYKGTAPSLTDLMGGHLTYTFADSSALPHIASGKLRVLAVSGERRLSALPEVPTMAEAGLPTVRMTTWYGVAAPANTPAKVIEALAEALQEGLNVPEVRARLEKLGAELEPEITPERLATEIRSDGERWGRFFRETNIKLD